jgi:hypothetical protein
MAGFYSVRGLVSGRGHSLDLALPLPGERGESEGENGREAAWRVVHESPEPYRETETPSRTVGPFAMLRTFVAPSTSSWRATPCASSTMRPHARPPVSVSESPLRNTRRPAGVPRYREGPTANGAI